MQPGFALLECGAVRSKNATNILVKNMLDAFIAGVAYWLFGWAFAYGEGNSFIGYGSFAIHDLEEDKYATWFFQYVFAATAATIVSGSLAERCNTTAYFTYSFIISGFIYPVVSRWAWHDDGWLKVGNDYGNYQDFAGSGAVHLCGGACALIGALLLGPRIGRFHPDTGEPIDIRGHSVPLTVTGGMILLVGFLAFNGGSLGHITHPGDGHTIAQVIANTTISGCFGGLTALLLVRIGVLGEPKVISMVHSMNGALAGMVSICAGVNNFHLWQSALIGIFASIVYILVHILVLKLKIDDPLDAIAVHLGGGLWGLIGAPIFAKKDGIILIGSQRSGYDLAWNIAGAIVIFTWSSGLSILMFGALKLTRQLRIDADTEIQGLDIVKHNEPAYPAESWFEEQYHTINKAYKRNNSVTPIDICLPPNMRAAKRSLDTIFNGGTNIIGIANRSFIPEETPVETVPNNDVTKF